MFDTGDEQVFFDTVLRSSLNEPLKADFFQFVSGGQLNQSVWLQTRRGSFFLKWHESGAQDMTTTEAQGLDLLRQTDTVYIPRLFGQGTYQGKQYLLMEYLDDRPRADNYWLAFGQRLAEIHIHQQAWHGLPFDNYIGPLPQPNEPLDDGVAFYVERRLRPLAGLAYYHEVMPKVLYRRLESFYERLPGLLPNERSALLHGDLCAGNVLTAPDGQVALVDPAPYYGYREAELAYARLLGGFPGEFYAAYEATFPLEPGFEQRVGLYNLYPLLIHVNLFGESYLSAVEAILDRFD